MAATKNGYKLMFNPFVTTFVDFPMVVGTYTCIPMAPQTVLGLFLCFTWWEGGAERLPAKTHSPRETYVVQIQSSKTWV
jgi:hypothetical protein